jgi:P pilus assembly chaperone PapD
MTIHRINIRDLILVLFLFVAFPSSALAGLKVVPSLIKTDLLPGKTYKTNIQVQNISREKTEELKVYLESSQKTAEGKWKYAKDAGAASIISWATVTPATISLAPGQRVNVTLQLKIPKTAMGDFKGALMFAQDPSRMASTLPIKEVDAADIQLGKHRRENLLEKTTISLIQYMRIAVPVHLRIMNPSASARIKQIIPRVKLGPLKAVPAGEGKGTLEISLPAENKGIFDLQVTGSCKILHGTTKSLLKIADISGERMIIMPEGKRRISFIFFDPLPAGNYIASASLKIKNRGYEKTINKDVKTPFTINAKTAAKLKELAGTGVSGSDVPIVPLLVDPLRIDLSPRSNRIKPLKLSVANPTKDTLVVRSVFRSASQTRKGRPSVKITPVKFTIKPGRSERVRVQIKPSGKGPVYGNLLFAVKGMKASLPAVVPVMIVPQETNLKGMGVLKDFEASTTARAGKFVSIMGWLNNSGHVHLDEISAEISIKDFLGDAVTKKKASVGKKILLPAEKTRLYSDFSLDDLKDDTYEAVFTVKSKNIKPIKKGFKFKLDRNAKQIVTLVK